MHTIRLTATNNQGDESGIILRSRLTLGLEAKYHNELTALKAESDSDASDFGRATLLLCVYACGWYGPAFPAAFSEYALLNYDGDSPLIQQAMTWCFKRYYGEPEPLVQPTKQPADDPDYEAMVQRWKRKLGKNPPPIRAGHHDQVVSLMARFGWTERQTLEDNSPEVIRELCARLEAEADLTEQETASTGRKKAPINAKTMFINAWDRVKELAKAGGING